MDEVTITCLGDTATVPDLGLHLSRGDVVKVRIPPTGSLDLQAAKGQGLVAVSPLKVATVRAPDVVPPTRTRIMPPGVEPQVVGSRASTVPWAAPQQMAPPTSPATTVDMTPVVSLLGEVLRELRGLREDLAHRPMATTFDPSSILSVLGTAMSNGGFVPPTVPMESSDGPQYIPGSDTTGLVGRVAVESTVAAPSASLDDAVATLKARKKEK